jgi:hypothetical protein
MLVTPIVLACEQYQFSPTETVVAVTNHKPNWQILITNNTDEHLNIPENLELAFTETLGANF